MKIKLSDMVVFLLGSRIFDFLIGFKNNQKFFSVIKYDVRMIIVEKIFAIPAIRGLCFLGVNDARIKSR